MFHDFISLIFPVSCNACGNILYKGERLICTYCRYHLPKTNFHLQKDNPVARHFWGKLTIESAAAFYFFNKGEKVQNLIHMLKYKHQKEIGVLIGELYGYELAKSELFKNIDIIIPVPLHLSKKFKRGYNQSDLFAKGLSNAFKKEVDYNQLYKIRASATQTKKSRFARWENVNQVFHLRNSSALENKHILLVDDVITTGSTLETCATVLLQATGSKVSIATIACA
jgi:ComF family protein